MFRQQIVDGWQVEEPGPLAAVRQPVGVRRGPRSRTRSASAAASSTTRDGRAACATTGSIPRASWPWPTTRPSRLRRQHGQHAAAVGGAGHRREFDLDAFNDGDYMRRGRGARSPSENISRVLYPDDNDRAGRELRLQPGVLLRQRVAAGHPAPLPEQAHASFDHAARKVAIQLNDTHPALGDRPS